MKTVALSFLVFLLGAGTTAADATAGGSVSWKGKSINYTIRGTTGASESHSSDANQFRLQIKVDGRDYQVKIAQDGIEYGKRKVALKPFSRVEIRVDPEGLRITVDGRQVVPEKKK